MKLNVGSGAIAGSVFENGWKNVDFSYCSYGEEWKKGEYLNFDIRQPWPLPPDSVDCIFASHIMEHVELNNYEHVITEMFKVLKPEHPARIICPDPRQFIKNWQLGNMQYILDCYGQENFDRWNYKENVATAFTDMFFRNHYDHFSISTIDMMMILMIKAGFRKVYEMRYSNTAFPEYFGAADATIDNRPVMSFYLEAMK